MTNFINEQLKLVVAQPAVLESLQHLALSRSIFCKNCEQIAIWCSKPLLCSVLAGIHLLCSALLCSGWHTSALLCSVLAGIHLQRGSKNYFACPAKSLFAMSSVDCTCLLVLNCKCLILYSPVVTICTTRFNTHKFYVLPTAYLCVLCGSENKQRLFPYTALTDWFL